MPLQRSAMPTKATPLPRPAMQITLFNAVAVKSYRCFAAATPREAMPLRRDANRSYATRYAVVRRTLPPQRIFTLSLAFAMRY
jgi:hypothetical protein